jgi:hypothetical protein
MSDAENLNSLTINLTEEDFSALLWVGGRYCWSNIMLQFVSGPGEVTFDEQDLIEIRAEMEKDTEGGHRLFPCLAPGSSLSSKMYEVYTTKEEDEL